MRLATFAVALTLTACTTLVAPQTFKDRVAYAEGAAQAVLKSIDATTCYGYLPNGSCREPGRPLSVEQSLRIVNQVATVRAALRISLGLNQAKSVGICLGETRTADQCLAAARELLLKAETYLREQGVK